MAVESKPLFHPGVIRHQVRSFSLSQRVEDFHAKLQDWTELIASGRADGFKETDLLPDFITDIFCNLLGYTRPAGPSDIFTLSRERHVEGDGKFADAAVLGRFQRDKQQGRHGDRATIGYWEYWELIIIDNREMVSGLVQRLSFFRATPTSPIPAGPKTEIESLRQHARR